MFILFGKFSSGLCESCHLNQLERRASVRRCWPPITGGVNPTGGPDDNRNRMFQRELKLFRSSGKANIHLQEVSGQSAPLPSGGIRWKTFRCTNNMLINACLLLNLNKVRGLKGAYAKLKLSFQWPTLATTWISSIPMFDKRPPLQTSKVGDMFS